MHLRYQDETDDLPAEITTEETFPERPVQFLHNAPRQKNYKDMSNHLIK